MERKKIPYFSGYTINKHGDVYTNAGGKVKPIEIEGDLYVDLGDGEDKCYRLRDLVYLTFVGNIPENHEVILLDGDKKNNKLNNLFLASPAEKVRHEATLTRIKYQEQYTRQSVVGLDGNANVYKSVRGTFKERTDELLKYRLANKEKGNRGSVIIGLKPEDNRFK